MSKEAPALDFPQTLQDFNQATASASEVRLNYELYGKWKDVYFLRQRMLDKLLEERGVAVCSSHRLPPDAWLRVYSSNGINTEELNKLSPEDLGIFPKSQMRLHFSRHTLHTGDHYMEHNEQFDELELLCPEHFPRDTNKSWGSNAGDKYKKGDDMESEVVEKDGRLFTVVDNIDVTDILVEKPYLRDEAIYRYFGLPEIPDIPQWINYPSAPLEDYRQVK